MSPDLKARITSPDESVRLSILGETELEMEDIRGTGRPQLLHNSFRSLIHISTGTTKSESRYLLGRSAPRNTGKVSDLRRKSVQLFRRTPNWSIFIRRQQPSRALTQSDRLKIVNDALGTLRVENLRPSDSLKVGLAAYVSGPKATADLLIDIKSKYVALRRG